MDVDCIKLHPRAEGRLSRLPEVYNVAVLKMRVSLRQAAKPFTPSAASVVDIRSAPLRPANRPEGVFGSMRNERKDEEYGDEISLRRGLLSDLNNEVDPLGEPISGDPVDSFLARTYINTVCLPPDSSFLEPDAGWRLGARDCESRERSACPWSAS